MRRLGKTAMYVKEIGLGGIPLQRLEPEDVKAIIRELIKHQANVIDTARGYTVSEALIGEAIQGCRHQFYLFTKSSARTFDEMEKDIQTSLNNLKTDYIDLYQFHNVKNREEYNLIMSEKGAYQALLAAKQSGKIGHIGLTTHNLDLLEEIIDDYRFETIQFPYNILETQAEALFEKAAEKDIGVVVMKPLAGGAIPNPRLALKFILNNPNISVAIPGMESVEQAKINLSVIGEPLSQSEIKETEKIRSFLNNDFCRRCGYCLPCTVGIDIPTCFTFEGYYTRYALEEWAYTRYLSLTKHASDCIECRVCESRCPYDLKIADKMKNVKRAFKL
ncbi:MAG: aldo/keto reductase [Bacilli bacterium]|nr:aldo/keto reductase [Bacilli bacterium]